MEEFELFGIKFLAVKKGTIPKKKYCEIPSCKKRAKKHILSGRIAKEPHSYCKRHYREYTNITKKQKDRIH